MERKRTTILRSFWWTISPLVLVLGVSLAALIWGVATSAIPYLICLFFACLVLSYRIYTQTILKPLVQVLKLSQAVAQGDMGVDIEAIGQGAMATIASHIQMTIDRQQRHHDFALKIGEGDYECEYGQVEEHDRLGHALVDMQAKLKRIAKEDAARNWVREGVAHFSGILTTHSEDMEQLANEFIRQLVKYLGANQAGLFLWEPAERQEDQMLNLVACYAWDRQKHLRKQMAWGEGLVWQAALEKEPIYITEVPESYARISSGIGEAKPRCILIVPLLSKGELQGVLELAAFKPLEKHQITFVERVVENLAINLASARTNEHTKKLLDESRKMTENLQSQEETLRKNAEEQEVLRESLQRAQEEMRLQLQQMEAERKKNLAVLEGCVDGVMTFDSKGKIAFFNKAAEEIWGFQREEILGKDIHQFIPIHIEKQKDQFIANYVNGRATEIDIRTEVLAHNASGEEMSVLLTVTKAQVGDEHTFTIFTQKISVELF